MKLNITKEWLERQASLEEGLEASTGGTSLEEVERIASALEQTPNDRKYLAAAFGSLIAFLRNRGGWSLSQLAEKADIDEGELLSIESKEGYSPELRTVVQLAKTLTFPPKKLLEAAGLIVMKDSELTGYAVKFAASGKDLKKLTEIQRDILDEFVKFLAK